MASLAERFPHLTAPAARDRTLPVHSVLTPLLDHLQRGTVVGCEGAVAVSLALAVAAGPSRAGAWVGVAGLAGLNAAAAAECGVVLERLVSVAAAPGGWGEVVAAMIDGFDVVVLGGAAARVGQGDARRLQARAQARGAVLVTVGGSSVGCDVRLRGAQVAWRGLGQGHGVVRARRVLVEAGGRRLSRPRQAEVWLPEPQGALGGLVADPLVPLSPAAPLSPVPAALAHTG